MNIIEISLKICGDNGNKSNKKMVKQGCWDIPRLCVGCYGFYVVVQCFFPAFDVLCGGDCGNLHFIVWFKMRGRIQNIKGKEETLSNNIKTTITGNILT